MKRIISVFLIIISLSTTTIMSVINYNAEIVGETTIGDKASIDYSKYFNPDALLEREDFDTDEEYGAYIDEFNKNSSPCETIASVSENTITVKANKVYELTGIKPKRMIQNFHVGVSYIYATSCQPSEEGTYDMYILRFKIGSDGKTATYQDKMTFENFGHNQILTPYTYNNKTYLWIGCKPNTSENDFWGLTTQFGRVQYEANKTYTHYNQICRFGNLNYANKSGSNLGIVIRNDGALSSNKEYFMLSVRCRKYESDGETYTDTIAYSCYDNVALNKALDKVEADTNTNLVVFKDNTTLKNACLYTIKDKPENLPNGKSCQGIELSNAFSLYISGGAGTGNNNGPAIKKFIKNGDSYVSTGTTVNVTDGTHAWAETELEGLQIYSDYLYFVLHKQDADRSTQCIYSIEKSKLN